MTTVQITLPALPDTLSSALKRDAANARGEGRLETTLAPFWDVVVADHAETAKRGVIIMAVLTACGEARDLPQTEDGVRTPYGNVVQRFGARYDAAVKRAKPEAPESTPDWLRLVMQAAENAGNNGCTPESIMAAVESVLNAESVEAA